MQRVASYLLLVLYSLPLVCVRAQPKSEPAAPPIAKVAPAKSTIHGEVRVDPYHWLREKTRPEVIAYLKAENKYTDAMTQPLTGLQETLYKEIVGRIKQTDLSVPYRLGDYWYYTRTVEGKQYSIHCRKKGNLQAAEQVLLDLNELAKGKPFLGLGVFEVSDDGNWLAYSLDTTGFREFRLYIKDLRTDKVLGDDLGVVDSLAWAADNKTIFYVREDAAKRAYRMFRRVLGNPKEELLFEEKDELFSLGVARSSDKRYVLLASGSSETTETQYLPSNQPAGSFRVMLPRENKHEYYADHREGRFYIRTNKDAKNFRLVTAPDDDLRPAAWKELLPHRPAVKLDGIQLFKNFAVFIERENGLERLRVHDFRSGQTRDIAFKEPTYSAGPGTNPEFATSHFRYDYDSFVTPSSVFDYDMETGKKTLLKQTEVVGGYDANRYVTERIFAVAADGVRIPISIVYSKDTKRDGSTPLLLYGYGAYGIPMSATFSIAHLSLLDRGVAFAIAHIRGGGEMGEIWHDDGKMMKKRNTFTDFIACAEHLVREKYTTKERLAIEGESAGGLLIGAVLNMRPDLFHAAHLGVPFVDVLNTMLDESLPLTVGEFIEWGNPKKKPEYDYMKSYCPYTNIAPRAYPHILVTTSLNDSQVMYWEPAKYVAKLRANKTDHNWLLFKINLDAGHGGASGRYDHIKEQALVYAFVLDRLGIANRRRGVQASGARVMWEAAPVYHSLPAIFCP